jgi:hypothetical protein
MKRSALALTALACLALSPMALHAQQVTGVHGWIEDGLAHKPGTTGDAVRKNVAAGAPLVFVDDKERHVWRIDDPEAVKGHEGHHVAFNGSMDPVGHSIHVIKLSMLKNQKPGADVDAIGHSAPPSR